MLYVAIGVGNGYAYECTRLRELQRYYLYQGTRDYRSIFSLDAFQNNQKLPANYPKERGRTLAMGSILSDLVQAIDE